MVYYLVTQGIYPDTAMVALLSEAALAESLAASLDRGKVIPIRLDAEAPHLRAGLRPYVVWLDAPDDPHPVCYPELPDLSAPEVFEEKIFVWARTAAEAIDLARQRPPQVP